MAYRKRAMGVHKWFLNKQVHELGAFKINCLTV